MRQAARLVDGHAARPAAPRELVAQAALADAGLAHDPDHLRPAGDGLLERRLEHPHLVVAADEAREAARARDVERVRGPRRRRQLVDAQRAG